MSPEKAVLIAVICLFIIFVAISSSKAISDEMVPLSGGAKVYMHYCTHCHGEKGDGKGFNAKNLDPRPAVHIDARLMSRRSNKDLYDVIYGGGRAVGKSTLMPPWGKTLNTAQVQSLIPYLRSLCKCEWQK